MHDETLEFMTCIVGQACDVCECGAAHESDRLSEEPLNLTTAVRCACSYNDPREVEVVPHHVVSQRVEGCALAHVHM